LSQGRPGPDDGAQGRQARLPASLNVVYKLYLRL
jgi:hypothetical protein